MGFRGIVYRTSMESETQVDPWAEGLSAGAKFRGRSGAIGIAEDAPYYEVAPH